MRVAEFTRRSQVMRRPSDLLPDNLDFNREIALLRWYDVLEAYSARALTQQQTASVLSLVSPVFSGMYFVTIISLEYGDRICYPVYFGLPI